MTIEKFTELIDDPTVTKVYGPIGGGLALYEVDRLIVSYTFMHTGHPDNHAERPRQRLVFNAFPLDQLTAGIPVPRPIENNHTIMVNAHEPLYAMTFVVAFDSISRIASIILNERPELGDGLLTQEETDGITVPY